MFDVPGSYWRSRRYPRLRDLLRPRRDQRLRHLLHHRCVPRSPDLLMPVKSSKGLNRRLSERVLSFTICLLPLWWLLFSWLRFASCAGSMNPITYPSRGSILEWSFQNGSRLSLRLCWRVYLSASLSISSSYHRLTEASLNSTEARVGRPI